VRIRQKQKGAGSAKVQQRASALRDRCNQSINVHERRSDERMRQRHAENIQKRKSGVSSAHITCKGWANQG
jgi:hypothetical protein